MPNINKVIDVAEDVLEDTAEKLEDGFEFLMRPEVILCILSLIILVVFGPEHSKCLECRQVR